MNPSFSVDSYFSILFIIFLFFVNNLSLTFRHFGFFAFMLGLFAERRDAA